MITNDLVCAMTNLFLGNVEEGHEVEVSELSYIKMTDENGQPVVVGETVTTLKDPHGNIRKITTIESYDADSGEILQIILKNSAFNIT